MGSSCMLILVLILIMPMSNCVLGDGSIFNMMDFGAVGDGIANDTIAFIQTWNATCQSNADLATMEIPEGKTFLIYPSKIYGNCMAKSVKILLSGNIIAPDDPYSWLNNGFSKDEWIEFLYVDNFTITGGGTLDGRGKSWWDIACKHNKSPTCYNKGAPAIISFAFITNLNISNINTVNSGGIHSKIFGCENVDMSSLNLQAPGDSPNTDGIRISHVRNVRVYDSVISTGDDCIGILDEVSNLNISNIKCGPGHGISIGSLGGNTKVVNVSDIRVTDSSFTGTTNGVRIKTHLDGIGEVHGIYYSNITLKNVDNPINIDQHYSGKTTHMDTSIHVRDVRFVGIYGTSRTQVAINLGCSERKACTDIILNNVYLKYQNRKHKNRMALAQCKNAYGSSLGIVVPTSCLK